MFPVNIIHDKAVAAGLNYLLIGGHALNAYGNPRATVDVDLLIRKEDREAWLELLRYEGFGIHNDGGNFLQMSPPYGVEWPLDLMLVADQSFSKLAAESREVETLGINTRVPGPVHLLALKLHAYKHGPESRKQKDFGDILTLAKASEFNPADLATKAVFEKYGDVEVYEQFLRAIQE